MMQIKQIIVLGLGNVGKEYENTKHNAGAIFVSYFVNKYNIALYSLKTRVEAQFTNKQKTIIFLQLKCYMNETGQHLLRYLKEKRFEDKKTIIIACHDDISFAFGDGKMSFKKNKSTTHNGVKSIINFVPFTNICYVKIGIDCFYRKNTPLDIFVLSHLTKSETASLNDFFNKFVNFKTNLEHITNHNQMSELTWIEK